MRDVDVNNMMAMWADAETRQTASLIEMIAAAALAKLAPPTGEDVATLTITEEDFAQAAENYHFESRYENGGMTIFLTPINLSPRK